MSNDKTKMELYHEMEGIVTYLDILTSDQFFFEELLKHKNLTKGPNKNFERAHLITGD